MTFATLRALRGFLPLFRSRATAVASFLLLAPLAVFGAELTLPAIFGDHMVLQREQPIAVWGTAGAGESVEVQFAGQTARTTAAADGRWQVTLPALPASAEGRTLTVRGDGQSLQFKDVLIGEVWLASGQSNMEKPFGPRRGQKPTDNSEVEIAGAHAPLLRLYQVPHHGRVKEGVDGLRWVPSSPESLVATQFSAVAYVFGRELHEALQVPVGIIHASYGGTQIEAWIPPDAWELRPALAGIRDVKYRSWVEGVQASELYQSMIAPLVPYPLRGFLWYQGETNLMQGESSIYTEKMHALIEGWRQAWQAPRAPFYFALLAPFAYSEWDSFPQRLSPENLPAFWEAQTGALAQPATGLVVTTDLVSDLKDIHPTTKRPIGERFARLALQQTYGRSGDEARSPQFAQLEHADKGRLAVRFRHTGAGLATRDGEAPTGFTLAGTDQTFHPAQARIDGDRVILWSEQVPEPVAVRFGWHERANPNVINSAGLPAVPFRTDDWPIPPATENARESRE